MSVAFFLVFIVGLAFLITGLFNKTSIRSSFLAIAVGIAGMGYFALQKETPLTCRGIVSDVLRISQEGASQNAGLKLIHVTAVTTVSENEQELKCKGTGMWSNTEERPLEFKMYQLDGQWFVSFQSE